MEVNGSGVGSNKEWVEPKDLEIVKVYPAVRWDFPGVLALLAPRFACVILDFAFLCHCLGPFPISCTLSTNFLRTFLFFPQLTWLHIAFGPVVKFALVRMCVLGPEICQPSSQKGSAIFFLRLEAKPICRFEKFLLKTVNRTLWILQEWGDESPSRHLGTFLCFFWHSCGGKDKRIISWQAADTEREVGFY